MVMRTVGTRHMAEDIEDLAKWVRALEGGPEITHTSFAACNHPAHGDEPATWFYVEADAEAGVARLRCLAGGHVNDIHDSADNWTFPGVWSCAGCYQSIAEVVFGIHDEAGTATWMVIAVRCVECGEVAGLTDLVLGRMSLDELLAAL
jgi:hypothetical protein